MGVTVLASCKTTTLKGTRETVSDQNGEFTLSGNPVGALADCQLSFGHSQFKSKTIKLEPGDKLLKGLMIIWKVNVELDPL
jgi:hypothetical protein